MRNSTIRKIAFTFLLQSFTATIVADRFTTITNYFDGNPETTMWSTDGTKSFSRAAIIKKDLRPTNLLAYRVRVRGFDEPTTDNQLNNLNVCSTFLTQKKPAEVVKDLNDKTAKGKTQQIDIYNQPLLSKAFTNPIELGLESHYDYSTDTININMLSPDMIDSINQKINKQKNYLGFKINTWRDGKYINNISLCLLKLDNKRVSIVMDTLNPSAQDYVSHLITKALIKNSNNFLEEYYLNLVTKMYVFFKQIMTEPSTDAGWGINITELTTKRSLSLFGKKDSHQWNDNFSKNIADTLRLEKFSEHQKAFTKAINHLKNDLKYKKPSLEAMIDTLINNESNETFKKTKVFKDFQILAEFIKTGTVTKVDPQLEKLTQSLENLIKKLKKLEISISKL